MILPTFLKKCNQKSNIKYAINNVYDVLMPIMSVCGCTKNAKILQLENFNKGHHIAKK